MHSSARLEIWICVLLLAFQSGYGFYLPGSYPHKYGIGDPLSVKVNSLTSIETEIPFSYYSLPFCKPPEGVKDSAENLGELLMGDRIENSPYKFKMYTNESQIFLCQSAPLSGDDFKLMKKRIDEMYQVNLILDNLPAIRYTNKESFMVRWTGYPVGIKVQDAYYMFNHLKFTVLVHKYEEANMARVMGTGDAAEMIPNTAGSSDETPGYMVVGFEVVPCNVVHDPKSLKKDLRMYGKYPSNIKCDPTTVALPIKENEPMVFTYEVTFEESDIKWPSRWDAYLKMEGSKVHWFSIMNSIMVITFLAGIVLVIFLRTVRRDLTRYEELDKEMNEELSGWKLVVGDVFRAPSNSALLCVMIGNGVQILGMAIVTVLFAALGFMSPASRGTLLTGMLIFFMILGIAAGYAAVRLWRTMGSGDGKGWASVSWKVACFFPGIAFVILTTLNFLLWHSNYISSVSSKFPAKFIHSFISMGFPIGYTEMLLPKFLIHTLSILSFLRQVINTLFRYLGLPDFLEPNISWSPSAADLSSSFPDSLHYSAGSATGLERSMSAVLIREILPVVKFSELVDPPESCAVCLYDFEEEDEIRNLANCRHVFHRSCLDRWMGYDRKTCPLCRTAVIPDDVQESFNEKFWAASGIPDFYGEFSQFAE